MAQFIAYDPNVKVIGALITTVVDALDIGKERRIEILKKHGLGNVKPDEWYSQQKWLDVFKEISQEIGDKTLYLIGKKVPSNAKLPPDIDTLEKGLYAIDMGYKMNHSAGEIGRYEVVSFDGAKRSAVVKVTAPYPSEFDRGIIMAFLTRFKPKDSFLYDVILDTAKESRINGADSCTYLVKW